MSYPISIITPSYNHAKYIQQTIESVLNQSISGLEYIVIDGGSKDNTLSILNNYSDKLTWFSEKDRGQAHAVNKGFKRATGDIIGWLNSDDIYYPETLKTVLDFFNTHPDVDVLYGKANHIDDQNHFINHYRTESWNINRLMNRCFISQPTVFFRRLVLECYGYLDESLHYCLDYEFWLRLATNGARFHYVPKLLSATRLHNDAKTVNQSIQAHKEQMIMIKRYKKTIPVRMKAAYVFSIIKQLRSIGTRKN